MELTHFLTIIWMRAMDGFARQSKGEFIARVAGRRNGSDLCGRCGVAARRNSEGHLQLERRRCGGSRLQTVCERDRIRLRKRFGSRGNRRGKSKRRAQLFCAGGRKFRSDEG